MNQENFNNANSNNVKSTTIRYSDSEVPIKAIPIQDANGNTVLLVCLRTSSGTNKLVVQDLSGKTLRDLCSFGSNDPVMAANDKYIYAFISDPSVTCSELLIFDAKSYEPLHENIINGTILNACCVNDNLCVCNRIGHVNATEYEVQLLDLSGNMLKKVRQSRVYQEILPASTGFYTAAFDTFFNVNGDYKSECETKFGKKFVENNSIPSPNCTAIDDFESHAAFVAMQSAIYVIFDMKAEGLMYFPDKCISGITFDPKTKSLIVCSCNRSADGNKTYENGTLEVIPISKVPELMDSSERFLIQQNIKSELIGMCHRIVDESNGDISKMILSLQQLDESRRESVTSNSNNAGDDFPDRQDYTKY